MARFQETGQLRQVSPATGVAQELQSLSSRLSQFKQIGAQLTSAGVQRAQQASQARGTASGQQAPITREAGVTQKPEFKEEKFFGGIEARAHNKALRSSYLASLKNDIRKGVARIESENASNLIGFNEGIQGFASGILKGVDPSVRQDVIGALDDRVTSSQISVQNATIKAQNDLAAQDLEAGAETSLDEALSFARNGDLTSSASGLIDYSAIIDSQVEAGFLSPGEAVERKRDAELRATHENIVGNVQRLTAGGRSLDALDVLSKVRENIPKGMSVEEHSDLTSAMSSQINAEINIRNRKESEEEDIVIQSQESNYVNLTIGVATGTSTMNDAVRGLRNGKISESQFDKIANTLNRRGQGINSFPLMNTIREDIRNGEDPSEIKDTIIANSGTNLTEATAASLIAEVDESQDKESVLHLSETKRARAFLVQSLKERGPLQALDIEAERRMAQSTREFETRVLGGESPFAVAEELIPRSDYEKAGAPSKEDLLDRLSILNQAFDNKQISEADYNFEFVRIQELQNLQSTIDAFDKARKGINANTIQ